MKPILVLYATREGQTRRIAEHICAAIRSLGDSAEAMDVAALPNSFSLGRYRAAVLAASVHVGKHEAEMTEFVKEHRAELEAMPSTFVSVSLAEASVEDDSRPPDERTKAAEQVKDLIDAFLAETGWHPNRVEAAAGALMYTKYNLPVRLIMKWIAHREGAATDTSHDYEYTDWEALDRLARDVSAVE